MLTRRLSAARGIFPLLIACPLLGACEPQDQEPIAADLKIVAQYGAGYSDWSSWRCTITGDGKVDQEIFGLKDTKKAPQLSKDDLRQLVAKIKEADFFALKERYEYDVTDNPTLILKVTLDKKTHEVVVYAPDHLKKNKEVKRFFRVWSEVLRKVPSPNPEQKPDLYMP